MQESVYKITLDIHEINAQHILFCKQGDTARRIIATLTEESELYPIAEGCIAVFSALKPDGKILFNEAQIVENTIVYDFTEQTANVSGKLDCELRLYGNGNDLITSPHFALLVHPAVYADVVESMDEVNVLTGLISEATALIESVNHKLSTGEFVPQLAVGTVETLPAGSAATVEITGTGKNPVLHFGIPQGEEGQAEAAIPDTALSDDSTRPVQNRVLKAALDGKADKAETEAALAARADAAETQAALAGKADTAETEEALAAKVDKIPGMGLSSNDFTAAEKEKLAGIAPNANRYELPDAGVTAEKLAAGAVSRVYTATLGTAWSGTEAPYSQTIAVPGLPDSDRILADLMLSEDWEAEEEAYACLTKMEAAAGILTVYAREKTETPLNLKLLVVHGSGLGSGGEAGDNEGGSSGGKIAVSVATVKDGSTVTSTTSYADGSSSVSVIRLDDNGDPVSVTRDGVDCVLSWEGFDA